VPIWWWSGDPLDPVRLREQMVQLIAGGIRQAVVLNLAPSGPLYGALADRPAFFTDAWWDVFVAVCRDAAELGFALWFYDQLGFSGADIQGRLVQSEPMHRGRSLERVSGGCPSNAEVLVDLGGGELICSVPRGFDYLSPVACAALLDRVHGEFERRVGAFFGDIIVGSFQDELPSMPSWSASFAEEFRQRRGYDLVPRLAALWGDGDAAVRADYQRTRAELAEEAFFRPLSEWHQVRGLAVGCDQQHPARAGYPLEATQQYADYLRTHRWFSAPGSDHWGEGKVHSSLAHLYDRPRAWIEAFHGSGWGSTLEETYDWLLPWLRAGATLFNPHAVYYSTRGGRWEWAPPSTCWRQPYWRHYPLFAQTVSRLCATLSWGDHVCDIAVLFPTTTVQARLDLGLDEALFSHGPGMSPAQDTYLEVVGRMHWYEPAPGVLDRDGRDFDVIDDDSLVRGVVEEGRLRIGRESYRAVVLPNCVELEETTAKALRHFAERGGVVVCIGSTPPELVGVARQVPVASELPGALSDVERPVTAPTPTLLRSDGVSSILLVMAAHPGATLHPGGARYRTEGYDFDATRYATSVRVSVRGVSEPVALWDPGTGVGRPVRAERDGDALHVDVPLTEGPCALLVFGPEAAKELAGPSDGLVMARPGAGGPEQRRLDAWTGAVIPTLDNSWGDFALPASPGALPVLLHRLEHRTPDGSWEEVTAGFGPRGFVRRASTWEQLVWSPTAGGVMAPDADEPRGFVPEEFLDLGTVDAGESVELRFVVVCESTGVGWLCVGSTAGKDVRWNGEPLGGTPSPYYAAGQVGVHEGDNLLEVTLTAQSTRRLRASWALRPQPEELPRPEWVTGSSLRREVFLDDVPTEAVLQLGSIGLVTLTVNGDVVARHGEFDNYSHVRQPRVRRYDLTPHLSAGVNTLVLQLHDDRSAAAVDAFVDDQCVVTDASWHGVTGGVDEVPHDPRWVQLRPRPHPLPDADPDHGSPGELLGGVCLAPRQESTDAFRVAVPPGTTGLRLPALGEARASAAGVQLEQRDGTFTLTAPAAGGTVVDVEVRHDGALGGGGLWAGPVEVIAGSDGTLALGDWSALGMRDWSGGVRYRATVEGPLEVSALDLGGVRGTAELRVNGRAAGCRLWSPYSFDVAGLFDEDANVVEVDVYNTLAPYVGAVSPTPWVLPGQTVSGLLGPVTLRGQVVPATPTTPPNSQGER
jgi:hypothetical protein